MKQQPLATIAAAVLLATTLFAQGAATAGITVICSNAIKGAMEKIVPAYETSSGRHINITYGTSTPLKSEIEGGRAFDLAVLTPTVIADLVKSGKVGAGTETNLAKSDLAVGIKKGAPKTDISTADAFKRRVLAAKSVTYTKEGASTAAFVRALTKLGILETLASRTVLQTVSGQQTESVAEGVNELAFAPVSELLTVPGVEVLGKIPTEFQDPVIVTAGTAAKSTKAAEVKAFVDYVHGPQAAAIIKASGMDPIAAK